MHRSSDLELLYYTKHVYGIELIYFADPDDAKAWYELTGGKKTITLSEMASLTSLTGIQFKRVFEPVVVK